MTEPSPPWGAVGDLVEELVAIATDLIIAVDDEGADAVRGALLRVKAIDPPAEVAGEPGGVWGSFAVVLAAMIDPDVPLSQLLTRAEARYPDAGARRLRPVR